MAPDSKLIRVALPTRDLASDSFENLSGQKITLSPVEQAVLTENSGAGTVDEILEQVSTSKRFQGIDSSSIRTVIESLRDRQLLVTTRQFLDSYAFERQPHRNSSIQTFVVPTCERPVQLRRALISYLEGFQKTSRTPRVVVVDDSQDQTQLMANRDVIVQVRKQFPSFRIQYTDRLRRKSAAQWIAKKCGIEERILNFSLLGPEPTRRSRVPSYGATRNTAQLATLGELCLFTDDDTTCDYHISGTTSLASLAVTRAPKEWSVYWPSSVEELEHRLLDIWEGDPFRLYEKILGRHPSEIFFSALEKRDFDDFRGVYFDPLLITQFQRSTSQIKVATCGVVGDSGATDVLMALRVPGPRLQQLCRDRQTYEFCLTHRKIATYQNSFEFGNHLVMQGYQFGFSNQGELPPYVPMYRGEDDVFMITMDKMGEGLVGRIPLAVSHIPKETRLRTLQESIDASCELGLSTFLSSHISHLHGVPRPARDPENGATLRQITNSLNELANRPPLEIQQDMNEFALRRSKAQSQSLQSVLEKSPDLPKFAQNDIGQMIQRVEQRLKTSKSFLPMEYSGESTLDGSEFFTKDLKQISEMYSIWSDLRLELQSKEMELNEHFFGEIS